MGLLRFLLAFLVVYGHCGSPFGGVGFSAQNAVQAFYMISGFYMTLVLREKYAGEGPAGIKSFYLNRWFRLYPSYLAVLGLTLLFCVIGSLEPSLAPPPLTYTRRWLESGLVEWEKIVVMAASQLSMLGLDIFNLVTLSDTGNVVLTSGATTDKYPLWRLLLVPQAWSLSIELYFYLLAPFIVTRSLRVVLYVAMASYAARLLVWACGGYHLDPWSYRFFPSELLFFLAGTVGYHVYARSAEFVALETGGKGRKAGFNLLLTGMLASSVWLGRMGSEPFALKSIIPLVFTIAVFLAVPALFRQTRTNRWDRLIGELSYPIYISHILIIWVVGHGNYHVGKAGFLTVSILTIALSYALYRWIDLPMDSFRHRNLSPSKVAQASHFTDAKRADFPASRI